MERFGEERMREEGWRRARCAEGVWGGRYDVQVFDISALRLTQHVSNSC